MAQGRKSMNEKNTNVLLHSLDEKRETLDKAWVRQREAQTEEFDQKKIEALLVDWVVASDQPFTEPEQPQFKAMLKYLHTRGELKIPGRTTIKDLVMGLGSVTVGKVKEMIKIALLAIVMTFVSSSVCSLIPQLLERMTGVHSGENMADLVWKTMQLYGLPGKVSVVMMDNTTNNDTMMASLERKHHAMSIPFDARMARLRCMPHTIHLVAEKMLQGIGAFKKQQGWTTNYQDDMIPLSAVADEELDNDDLDNMDVDNLIVWVVPKLRRIICSIRVSPQSRENWLQTATMTVTAQELPPCTV
ncbi:hypothetical protein EXIGLDRAFT_709898 [Exidia glandulosa HHB12029]|uniref:DUF659 domain-containing protein n=1 Tax=Exidia glandulosa HHB12029 TaxID=1314781 RepID=A0A166MQS8_EXIGL|nr:hypothetical protein EXIGLDRAFT_709898 [Exidia glandulosa HHB12029]